MHTVGHVFSFHGIVSSTVKGECFGVPDLPVVIEQGGIERQRFVEADKREAEESRRGRVFITGLGNPHMRYKIARNVKTGQLDAVGVALDGLEKSGCDTLGAENGAYPPTLNGLIHPVLPLNWP